LEVRPEAALELKGSPVKKNILLATTGESPQVITETLYALNHESQQWPDEIFLITTTLGETRARVGLLEQSHLARLCDEIGKPVPEFDTRHILVVPDANGQPVDDARSLEDHEALANFIMTTVRNLTAVDSQTVHASLAGGRKTMTFYMGYAMSLFGRRQDNLSHVLISKGYESLRDFWYPSIRQDQLRDYDGKPLSTAEGYPLMPADALVTLAPIPFVRHRQNLPALLPQSGSTVHFRDLVRLINLGDLPDELHLCIDLPKQRIIVRDTESPLQFEFKPSLLALAFYGMMARATLAAEKEITRPSKKRAHTGLLKDLLDELLPLCGLPRCENWKSGLEQLIDWNELKGQLKDSTLDALGNGITDTWFDQRKGELRKAFEEKLPARVSGWLTPEIIWGEDGDRLTEPGSTKGGGYGIPLLIGNIDLIDCPYV
jgi:CRISPR-associated protein (TIGR02584 family)